MVSDKKDREALKSKLEMCIHPLNPEVHPEQLVNVENGTFGASEINVDQQSELTIAKCMTLRRPLTYWILDMYREEDQNLGKIKTMAKSKPWQDQNHGKIKTMARSKTWQD